MKIAVRIILCTALMAVAVTMGIMTLAGFRGRSDTPASGDGGYILASSGDVVAVYPAEDPRTPLYLTDIPLATLREADREMLSAGLPAETEEEVAQLLEDLGS